jgi:hypothetical protein
MFLIDVNDLPNCQRTTTASMFVDDINLTASGATIIYIQTKWNSDLEKYSTRIKLNIWLPVLDNGLAKSIMILVLNWVRKKYKNVKETKISGVILDDKLKCLEYSSRQCSHQGVEGHRTWDLSSASQANSVYLPAGIFIDLKKINKYCIATNIEVQGSIIHFKF